MWASQSRAGEVASLLLDCGASLEAEDDAGMTALLWAAQLGRAEVARQLLIRGADAGAMSTDGRGAAALCSAHTCKLVLQDAERIQRWHRRRHLAMWHS